MRESIIRELIRLQDILHDYYSEFGAIDFETWQAWALANEKVVSDLRDEVE